MPAELHVAGPTVVKIGASILGYSDNDNLPQISFTDHQHEVKTVLSGATPEEIVLMGTTARISVALVKWDQAVLNATLLDQRGTAAANSTVGRLLVSAGGTFALEIASVNAGGDKYTFSTAYLLADGVSDTQWGNRERVLTLNFGAFTAPGTALYTYAGT